MKKLISLLSLSMLLSVNVLTPMTYATENLWESGIIPENGSGISENEGGIAENRSGMAENDSSASSWTDVKEQNGDPQDSSPKGSEWQAWSWLDISASPQNDEWDGQPPQNDEREEPQVDTLPAKWPSLKNAPLRAPATSSQLEDFTYDFISIEDPANPGHGITIMDRNLWATTTWAGAGASVDSYWYYYQRWNNYGFPTTWTITNTTSTRVNVAWYWPDNYYYSDTFVKWSSNWTTSNADTNLRWGWTDAQSNNRWLDELENTLADRQWPCPAWTHVPTAWERSQLLDLWVANYNKENGTSYNLEKRSGLSYSFQRWIWTAFANELYIPFAAWRDYFDASVYSMGYFADLWSSSPSSASSPDSRYLNLNGGGLGVHYSSRANALSVRCFYDSYQPLTQSFSLSLLDESGVEIVSGSVESGAIWTGTVPDLSDAKEGRNFLGRYYDADDSEENIVDLETFQITKDTVLRAKFEIAQFTINFVDEDGSVIAKITQNYNTDIQKPTNPEKKWYEFIWWDIEIPETMPAETLTITAQWKKKSSGRSWGGWRSWWGWSSSLHGSPDDNTPQRTWDTQDSSAKPQNDNNVSSWTNVKDLRWDTQDSLDKSSEWQTWSQMDTFPSPQNDKESELFDMHKWAYDNWLTIYKPWEDAKFDQPLTRQQMAKISSIFWYKFLNQKADDSEWKVYECSQYTDLHKSKWEMRWYVVQSCLLWNMWYAYDGVNLIKKFNPYNKLTVAQASVILSRMAWWDKYIMTPKQWYQWHMYAVYDHGLIDDISNPQREVTRWEAFMMMYRLSLLMK